MASIMVQNQLQYVPGLAEDLIQVRGRLIDEDTHEPVQYASVGVTDQDGNYLGDGTTSDMDGEFLVNSLRLPGNFITVSHTQYYTDSYSTADMPYWATYGMKKQIDELEEVVVTPGKKDYGLMIAAGLIMVGLIAEPKKKNKTISGPGAAVAAGGLFSDPVIKWGVVIVGGVVVNKVFGLTDKFLEWLGIQDTKETKELNEAAESPNSFWNPKMWEKGGDGTVLLTESIVQQFIETIYDAIGAFNDDEDAIIGVFKKMKTQSQASYMADKFQQRYGADMLKWLRGGSWPQDRLSDADVAEINSYVNKLPKYKL